MTTNAEEQAAHRQLVEQRKAHGRWLQTQVKCIYCLAHTDRYAHTLGLPFCQNDHFQRYSRGEHSLYLKHAQDRLSQTTQDLQYINGQYLAGNQAGLYKAHEELTALRERVIEHSIDYKLSVARYNAYAQEVPDRFNKPQESIVQQELLHVIARLVGSLNTCVEQTDTLALQIEKELQQLPAIF